MLSETDHARHYRILCFSPGEDERRGAVISVDPVSHLGSLHSVLAPVKSRRVRNCSICQCTVGKPVQGGKEMRMRGSESVKFEKLRSLFRRSQEWFGLSDGIDCRWGSAPDHKNPCSSACPTLQYNYIVIQILIGLQVSQEKKTQIP